MAVDATQWIWFCGWIFAVLVLFTTALRLPEFIWRQTGPSQRIITALLVVSCVIATAMFANLALVRHDRQIDFTSEHVYTPDPDALAVIDGLKQRVALTYFYRSDDPEGVRAKRVVEALGLRSALLEVTTSDPDRDPSLARMQGSKLYNAALLESADNRLIVNSTDEKEIALGIQRLLRERQTTICFMRGHDEYPSDNYEFHTHIEAIGGSGHNHGANAVIETAGHGVGRLRRSLEALGHAIKEITPAIDAHIDGGCDVLIDAGPRTAYSDVEAAALETYLASGRAALLLYDVGLEPSASQRRLLRRLGVVLSDSVIVDRTQHYAGDAEMVAATSYDPHPITHRVSFTFFPGVRALELVPSESEIVSAPLVRSGAEAERYEVQPHHHAAAHASSHEHARTKASEVLAVTSEGRWPGADKPFRAIVVGDADFLSNSFYPYMSNNRLALSMIGWLARDESGAAPTPRATASPAIVLSRAQQRYVFAFLVLVVPLVTAIVGTLVWYRRRA